MKDSSRRKEAETRTVRPHPSSAPENPDPYALEPLEPRLLLAADLGAGLDLVGALSKEADGREIVAEIFEDATADERFGELSVRASSVWQATDGEGTPLDLAQLGGLLANGFPPTDQGAAHGAKIPANSFRDLGARQEVVFLDSGVGGYEALLADLERQQGAGRQLDIHLLNPQGDGVAEIGAVLSGYQDLDAVHIVSHGGAGWLRLGPSLENSDSLAARSEELAAWRNALGEHADLLLYGCEVAGDPSGALLVEALASLTGADVVASDDPTGHGSQGGDWDLEYRLGTVEASNAFSSSIQDSWRGVLALPNSAPLIDVPGAQGTGQDTPLVLWGAGGNAVSITDIDAGVNDVEVTLTATDGSVSLSLPGGQASAVGGEFRVNSTVGDKQQTHSSADIGGTQSPAAQAVATDALGNYVVVWSSKNQDGDGWGVYGQRYNAAGEAQGVEFRVNDTSSDHQAFAAVAMDADGDFAVSWSSNAQDGDKWGVYAELYAADGTVTRSEFQVNSYTTNEQAFSQVAMDAAGNFVVVWSSKDQAGAGEDNDSWGIYAQRFDNTGTAQGGEILVNSYTTREQLFAAVAMDADGDFVVSWSSNDNQDGDKWGIYAQRFNAAGVAQGGEIAVNVTSVAEQHYSSVGMDAAGNFVVSWSSNAQDGDGWGVYARRFDASGSALGGEFRVANTTADAQQYSNVAVNSAGDFVISWSSNKQDGDGWGVFAREYAATGSTRGEEFQVSESSGGDQQFASVSMDASGNYVVVWSGEGAGDTEGVYGQRYLNASGLTFFAGDGTDDAAMTFRGDLQAVNNALDGLVFTPGLGFTGTATLQVAVDDLGNTGNGGALSDSEIVNIDVIAGLANAAPLIDVPGAQGTGQDTPLVLWGAGGNAVSITDIDAGVNDVEVTLTATDGSVSLSLPGGQASAVGGEFRVNSTVGDKQQTHSSADIGGTQSPAAQAVATDALGNYVVVWSSKNQDGDGWGVYGQRYNAAGEAQGVEFRVNDTSSDHQAFAAVAMDADGDFAVSWSSNAQDGDKWGVYAELYAADGTVTRSEFQVNSYTTNEQAFSQVAMDAAGNFVVVWSSKDQAGAGEDNDSWGIYAQRFDNTGTAQGGEILVNSYTTREQLFAAVAMDADGDFVVSWSSNDNQDGDKWGIYAQRFNAAGVAQGGEIAVNVTSVAEQHYSSVGMDAAGNFVVSWSSNAQDGDGWGVYARRFDASGSALGGEFRVANTTADAQQYSNVAVNSAGDFVISWSSNKQDGDGWGVFAREYAATGSTRGEEFQVSESSGGDQQFASVSMDASGNYVVVWSGEGAGDTEGVYGQRYLNASGLTFFAGDGTDDAAMTFRGDLQAVNNALDGLVFTPGLGFTGTATLQVAVDDLGNTGNGGALSDSEIVNIDVIAGLANAAPLIDVPGAQGTGQDTPLVLWGAGGNAVSITDIDAGVNDVEVTLTATDGSVSLSLPGGQASAVGGEFRVNSTVGDKQQTHSSADIGGTQSPAAQAVATDALGNYVVVWSSKNQDGDGWGVYGQRYNAAGEAQGVEFRVNDTSSDHQAFAAVAMDADGDFAVSWSSNAQDGDKWGVYAELYAADGTVTRSEFQVNSYTTNEQAFSQVAMDAAGNFVVVWSSKDQAGAGEDNDSWGIYAQRFDNTGTAQGGEILVNSYTTREQLFAAVAMDADGDFVVSWSSNDNQDGDKWGIYAQRFNAAGVAQGGEIAVNVTSVAEQHYSSVGMDAAGNFVVSWSSNAQDGDGWGVYARRFDASGSALGGEFRVANTTADAQQYSNVAVNSAGDFVISWSSNKQDGDGWGVFAREYAATGSTRGEEFQVSESSGGDQQFASVSMDASGNYVVVWSGEGAGDTEGVYGQRYLNASGLTFFAGDGTDDAAMTFRGDLQAVNNALDGLVFTPGLGFTGTATLQVAVDDLGNTGNGGALSDSEILQIFVGDNTAPVLGVIGDQSIDELATLSFTATATDIDLPADTLTFSLDGASIALGMSIDANTGVFSWTPTAAQGGLTPSVTVIVTDSGIGSLVDSETFTITVNDINVAPVLGAIGDQAIDELATLSFTATATDSDLPADTLVFSLDAASIALGMSIDANTGVFSWTPTEGQGGLTPSVTVTVTDDGTGNLIDSETFTVTVNDLNAAPVLGVIGDQSVDELSTLSFTATATDSDLPADTLTFSLDAASIALGMSIDPSSGAFSWTPTEAQGGLTPSVTVTVTDDGTGSLIDSETFTVTVNDINTGPVLGAIGDQSVDEGATLSFTATATDADLPADTLTFSLDAASIALGMSIDANTGAFSWTPTEGEGGTAPSVTVTVTDSGTGNLVDSETFTITVNDLNVAPVLGSIGDQSINELSTLNFTATATDADLPADTLTFSLDAASVALGMSIDANSGAFSWTPSEAQGGLTPSVTITVTDDGTGSLIDSETFTITVNDVNTAPVLGAIGDQGIDEGATLSFTATATDPDLPADTLTFSLDGASVALGMSIDANSGAFSWTPSEAQGGLTPSVTITVIDDGTGNLIDSETFTITVNDLNTAPVLGAIGDQSVDELATLSFTATATDADLPADTLTFSLDAASVALGMSIDANSGAFSWTPTEGQGGLTPSVTVTVTDDGTGSLIDSETFTVIVNDTNTAPVLAAIGDQSVDELATLSFTATATDSDLPADTLSFSLDAASVALGMSIDANTGAFSWTPTEVQGGTAPSVTVTVTDSGTGNLVDSETFTITVNDLNTAPVLGAIGDQSVDELATLSLTATATDADLPADTLSFFSLDAASVALGMSIDSNSGAFSWTPTEAQGGLTPSVTVTVTDDGTGSLIDNETFTITVNDLNTAPVLGAIGDQSIDELATLSLTATATDSDLPADTLTFSLDGASVALGMSIDANSGAFSWTPSESQGGLTPSVTVTVTDDGTGNLVDSETFTITVNDLNTAPVLGVIGDQSVDELATLSLTATATDADLPADTLAFSLDAASVALGMTIDANTGAFSWTPTEAQGGLTPSVTVTVTDDGTGSLIDNETFTITVNDLNTAPVLGAIGDQSIDEGATLSFTATATDPDLPADTLTFSLDGASVALGMSIDANSGAFSWTPSEAQGGLTPSVTVTVTDDGTGNLIDSETFTITVNDVNTAPVLGAIGDQSIDEGATLSFTATATDPDLPADTLTFSLDGASVALGMSIDANSGAFSWTPSEAQGGLTPSVTVTVTDDGTGNLIDSETFTITVNDVNTAPVLGAIGDQSIDEGATLSFTATATDPDLPADTLTFSLDGASVALGMSIDANSGAFSWTPTEAQGGLTPSVTVTVTDDGTGSLIDNETFTITVNDINVAPVLGPIGDQSIDEGATLSFTATATDADLPADTLAFSLDGASMALGMTIDTNTGAFSWTPTEGQGGLTPSVTVTVTDDGTGSLIDSETFTVIVNDTNTAPVLAAIGDQSVDELATLSFTATATDSDLPADTLSFSLDAASVALGMSIDANTGAFSWTPTDAQGGLTPSVTITVTDDGAGNLIDSETFTITVNDINVAPVLGAIGDQSIDEGATLSFTATATDADLPADTLNFSLDAASVALGMSIDPNTGAFSWTPTEGQGGLTPSVTVTVTDSGIGNLIDSETFTITVNDVNIAPVLGAIGDQSIDEGATLNFTATATDADLPADTLAFSLDAASMALGMSIDANTGAFSWTPTEGQGGLTPTVTVTVTDDGTGNLIDSETFTITVNDVNIAPVLGAIGDQSVDELATLSFTATATDSDLPADTLTFRLDAASIALGMSIDANTGAFSWTPTEGQGGLTPSVTVTVTDDGTGNLIDSETFTITVNDVNVAPVLGAIGDQSVDELATLSFTATATDNDLPADALTFSLDAASIALGMSIDANSGAFSWTPTEGQGGLTPSVTVTITDSGTGNLIDSETFTITVNDVNDAPTGTDNRLSTLEDNGHTFAVSEFGYSDSDDALLAVNVTTPPNAGTLLLNGVALVGGETVSAVDIAAGKLVFIPPADANGTGYSSFTFQVQDDGGTSHGGIDLDPTPKFMNIDIVAINDAPLNTGSLPASIAAEPGEPVDVDLSKMDLDDVDAGSGILTLTLSTNSSGRLQAISAAGVSVGGSGSDTLTVSGTLAALNAFMDNPAAVQYIGNSGLSGAAADVLTISIDDNGNTGLGSGLSTIGRVSIDGPSAPVPVVEELRTSVDPDPVTRIVVEPNEAEDREDTVGVSEEPADPPEESINGSLPAEPATGDRVDDVVSLRSLPFSIEEPSDRDNNSSTVIAMHAQLEAILKRAIAEQQKQGLQSQASGHAPLDPSRLLSENLDFRKALDDLQENVAGRTALYEAALRSGAILTTGLSIGYIAWLAKGGLMAASLVTSLPVWRVFDPIPVLLNMDDSREDEDDDGESLASLFDSKEELDEPADNDGVGDTDASIAAEDLAT